MKITMSKGEIELKYHVYGFMIVLVLFGIFFGAIFGGCSRSTNNQTEDMYADNISMNQARMIQATTQIVLAKYGYEDDTSALLKDWTVNVSDYPKSKMFVGFTMAKGRRIKAIYAWSGKDEDDLMLAYLAVGNKDVVNDLDLYK